MRTAFIDQLIKEARTNDKIFLLVGDLGYNVVELFAKEFPNRFRNVGIAEQNMAGMAAGLAFSGFNVYIYSIGNFPTLRCIEQIRNDIAYHHANVKVVSVGGGYAYADLGATHHATEALGMMRAIPNMVVCAPSDPIEARALTTLSASYEGPMYIQLGKAGEKIIHTEAMLTIKPGDILPIIVSGENKKAVLSCGNILVEAKRQMEENGLRYNLYSVPVLKPIDSRQLKVIVEKHPEGLVTFEEHQLSCGLGSAIVEQVNDMYVNGEIRAYPKIRRIGIQDLFLSVSGSTQFLREQAGLVLE